MQQREQALAMLGEAQRKGKEERRIQEQKANERAVWLKEAQKRQTQRSTVAWRNEQAKIQQKVDEENAFRIRRQELQLQEAERAKEQAVLFREKQKLEEERRKLEEEANYIPPGGLVVKGNIDFTKTHFHNPLIVKHQVEGKNAQTKAWEETEAEAKRKQDLEAAQEEQRTRAQERGEQALFSEHMKQHISHVNSDLEKLRLADGNHKAEEAIEVNRTTAKNAHSHKNKQKDLEKKFEELLFSKISEKQEWKQKVPKKAPKKETDLDIPQVKSEQASVRVESTSDGAKKIYIDETPKADPFESLKKNSYVSQPQSSKDESFQFSSSIQSPDKSIENFQNFKSGSKFESAGPNYPQISYSNDLKASHKTGSSKLDSLKYSSSAMPKYPEDLEEPLSDASEDMVPKFQVYENPEGSWNKYSQDSPPKRYESSESSLSEYSESSHKDYTAEVENSPVPYPSFPEYKPKLEKDHSPPESVISLESYLEEDLGKDLTQKQELSIYQNVKSEFGDKKSYIKVDDFEDYLEPRYEEDHQAPTKRGVLLEFGDENKTLADAFSQKRKAFVDRIQNREKTVPKKQHKEKTKEELLEIRKNMMKKPRVNVKKNQEPALEVDMGQKKTGNSELMERLANGERTKVSKREMKQLTSRNYQLLPEVKKKKQEEEKRQAAKLRMEKAKEYEKQRRQMRKSKK